MREEEKKYWALYFIPMFMTLLCYITSDFQDKNNKYNINWRESSITQGDSIFVTVFYNHDKSHWALYGETPVWQALVWKKRIQKIRICDLRGYIRADSLINELKRCNNNNLKRRYLKISLRNKSWFTNFYNEEEKKKYKYGYIHITPEDTIKVSLNDYIMSIRGDSPKGLYTK